jgi:glucokinase
VEVLAADVGGTHARLAIGVVEDAHRVRWARRAEYRSRNYPGLAPIAREFLAAGSERPEHACFALAGPVKHGVCAEVTNLPWSVSAAELAEATGIADTMLLNDFAAAGYGLRALGPDGVVTLQEGHPDPEGLVGLIGAGTGLGMGFVIHLGGRPQVFPSEGGHRSFAPENEVEDAVLRLLREAGGDRISTERVVSGKGMYNVYRALLAAGVAGETAAVRDELTREDPGKVISRHALAGDDPLSVRTLDVFLHAYGSVAGDLALTLLCYGGLYVAGGIATRILPALRDGRFLEAFLTKGRLSDVAAEIPVRVVTDPTLGLLGAAVAAWAQEPRAP